VNLLDPTLVEANRRGEITANQEAWLKRGGRLSGNLVLAVIVGLFVLIGVVMFLLSGSSSIFTGNSSLPIVGLVCLGAVGLLILVPVLRAIRKSTDMVGQGQAALIRQAVGELAYGKNGYQLRAGDQLFSFPDSGDPGGLLPGVRYTVYFKDGRNLVLSAEQLGDATEGTVRQAILANLAQAYRFSDEDLQANRSGELTAGQRTALLRKAIADTLPLLLGLVFALSLLYPYLATGKLSDSLSALVVPLVLAAFALASGAATLYRGLGDALSGVVESTQGIGRKSIERRASGRSRRTVYLYNIGDQKFEVPKSAQPALIDGAEYRVSFTPRARRMLTIEPISVPGIPPFGA
jgi:hypothetical protein